MMIFADTNYDVMTILWNDICKLAINADFVNINHIEYQQY